MTSEKVGLYLVSSEKRWSLTSMNFQNGGKCGYYSNHYKIENTLSKLCVQFHREILKSRHCFHEREKENFEKKYEKLLKRGRHFREVIKA